jgi:FKBP-type peptidyl-prolyl cis-trans isomerase FkpA
VTFLRMTRPTLSVVACLALALGAAGCGSDSPTAPSSYAPFSTTDLRVGTGASAVAGNTLTVHYTGWLFDGSKPDNKGLQFETSRGGTPYTFILGVGAVIQGWEQGIVGMNGGGLRRVVIPPSLAYGGSRVGIIPPNATLVFEVELLEVQ